MTMIDFEAEGLLDDVEGEARQARRELLERLAGEGVPLEELREAVEGGRLVLLPVERAVAGDGPRYTPREIAEIAGAELDLLQRATAAVGIPYPDPDDRSLTTSDLEEAKRIRAFLDAGLPEEGIVQVARTIGMATARIAEANRDLVVRTLMQPGDTEGELAHRLASAAERQPSVRARDRNDAQINLGREGVVDREFGLAGGFALRERGIVEERKLDRALDLVGALAGEKHGCRVGVDAAHRRAMGRRIAEQREHLVLRFGNLRHGG